MSGNNVVHAARCVHCGRAVSLPCAPPAGARASCVPCFFGRLTPEQRAFVEEHLLRYHRGHAGGGAA